MAFLYRVGIFFSAFDTFAACIDSHVPKKKIKTPKSLQAMYMFHENDKEEGKEKEKEKAADDL